MTVYWCYSERDGWTGDWIEADSPAAAAEKYVAEQEYGGTIYDAHEYGPICVDDDVSVKRYSVAQASFHAKELAKHD